MTRYPSDLRVHCITDEEEKKLTVTFKIAHNTTSYHKTN